MGDYSFFIQDRKFKPLDPKRVMMHSKEDCPPDKTCPLKEMFGNLSHIECTRDRCGWWDHAYQQCAVTTIANR